MPPLDPPAAEIDRDDADDSLVLPYDLRRLLHGVFRKRWLVALITAGIAALTMVFALFGMERKWEASAVMMQKPQTEIFSLGSDTPYKMQNYSLETMLDTIKLPSALDSIIAKLNLKVDRRTLSRRISVKLGKSSSLVLLTARWKDPETAVKIANLAARQLQEWSRKIKNANAADAFSYYSAQLEETRINKAAEAEKAHELKQASNISDIDFEINLLVSSIDKLAARLAIKQAELSAHKSTIENINIKTRNEPKTIINSTIFRNPLKQRLHEYEMQLQEALGLYTDDNPKVQRLHERIAILQKLIAENTEDGAPEIFYAPNPRIDELMLLLTKTEAAAQIVEAQIDTLRVTYMTKEKRLGEIMELKNRFDTLKDRLARYDRLEQGLQARADEARLMMLRGEAVLSIQEPAVLPDRSLPTYRGFFALGGVIGGFGMALGIVLLLVLLNPFVHTRREVEILLGTNHVIDVAHAPTRISIDAADSDGYLFDDVAFRRVTNLILQYLDAREDGHHRIFSISAAAAGETALDHIESLAGSMVQKGKHLLVIDADLRHKMAGQEAAASGTPYPDLPGVADMLCGGKELDQCILPGSFGGADFIPRGDISRSAEKKKINPLLLLGQPAFEAFLASGNPDIDQTIISLPPLVEHETVIEAAQQIGGHVLICSSGKTRRRDLVLLRELIGQRNINLTAVILLNVPPPLASVGV